MISLRLLRFLLFAGAGAFVGSAFAQGSPDVNMIRQKVNDAAAQLNEFEVSVKSRIERVSDSGERDFYTTSYTMSVRRPNQFRMETEDRDAFFAGLIPDAPGTLLTIGDGRDVWMFAPMLNKYGRVTTSVPQATAFFRNPENWVAGFVGRLGADIREATLVGHEEISVNNEVADCWILAVLDTAAARSSKLWIDKRNYRIVKQRAEGPANEPSRRWTETVVNEFNFDRVNRRLPDEVFVFTPPAGTKNEDFVLNLDSFR